MFCIDAISYINFLPRFICDRLDCTISWLKLKIISIYITRAALKLSTRANSKL